MTDKARKLTEREENGRENGVEVVEQFQDFLHFNKASYTELRTVNCTSTSAFCSCNCTTINKTSNKRN